MFLFARLGLVELLYLVTQGWRGKTPLTYRLAVTHSIITYHLMDYLRSHGGNPSSTPIPTRLLGQHFSENIPATENKLDPTQ